MNQTERYESAKEMYKSLGIDTDQVIQTLKNIPVSLHCWQGDDVKGFDQDGPLTGGIQTTGNYPGRARTPQELMDDMEMAMSLMPGKKKLNLHASYAIFEEGGECRQGSARAKVFCEVGGICQKAQYGH